MLLELDMRRNISLLMPLYPEKPHDFPLTLANLWAWWVLCGIVEWPLPFQSSASCKQEAHIPVCQGNQPWMITPLVSLNTNEPPSFKRPRCGAVWGLRKKLTMPEAVRPHVCANPGFPHFSVVLDLCLVCLRSLSEQSWQCCSQEGLSGNTISVLCSSTYLKSRANVQNNLFH